MAQAGSQRYSGPVLKLGFLWHQHQPYYKDLLTGEYFLPWVRLHGVKDYLDMVEILDQHPQIKQTFNMVPSLLEQIIDYADGKAIEQNLTLTLKQADQLSDDDKSDILRLFFQANYDHLIAPNKRYNFLYKQRESALAKWTEFEWRDLQTLANLAWIDPMYKASGRLKELEAKGEKYTEGEKREILDEQRGIISRIIPTLKRKMDDGQIEVSVTPFFHPILPLLCDTDSAITAMPTAPMPKQRFRHPEDAERHVADAVEMYRNLFGREPKGMWPSEGSVSEEIIPILHKYGINWIATDEEILSESLGVPSRSDDKNSLISSGDLYKAYKAQKDEASISIFFRDHALSDNIGFVYSNWDGDKAAADFMMKLEAIHKNLISRKAENPIVSVMLDGENAWEYYKNDGHDFLDALYKRIADAPWLETVTFGDYLKSTDKLPVLKKLFPGSWINHNFSVWIGHDEDNRAWDLLFDARRDLVDFENSHPDYDKDKLKLAWKELMISEGSDWCWWFGEDHVGPNNDDFDRLFRSHLANIYHFIGLEPPLALYQPIRTSFLAAHVSKPIDYITPIIDGKLTHYYEWQQAGFFDCLKAGSTMHKAERLIAGIWFGFDTDNLYLKIDRGITVSRERFANFTFEIEFFDTRKVLMTIQGSSGEIVGNDDLHTGFDFALKDLLELSCPLKGITD